MRKVLLYQHGGKQKIGFNVQISKISEKILIFPSVNQVYCGL